MNQRTIKRQIRRLARHYVGGRKLEVEVGKYFRIDGTIDPSFNLEDLNDTINGTLTDLYHQYPLELVKIPENGMIDCWISSGKSGVFDQCWQLQDNLIVQTRDGEISKVWLTGPDFGPGLSLSMIGGKSE